MFVRIVAPQGRSRLGRISVHLCRFGHKFGTVYYRCALRVEDVRNYFQHGCVCRFMSVSHRCCHVLRFANGASAQWVVRSGQCLRCGARAASRVGFFSGRGVRLYDYVVGSPASGQFVLTDDDAVLFIFGLAPFGWTLICLVARLQFCVAPWAFAFCNVLRFWRMTACFALSVELGRVQYSLLSWLFVVLSCQGFRH